MSFDAETRAVYDAKADEYASLMGSDAPDDTLAGFIGRLPEGAHVLDYGCGPGFATAHMARAGLRVDAFDISEEMVALANANEGVNAWVASFDALDAIDAYDGIWANFSLLHAPRADIPKHLAAIARALKAGGQFYIAVKTGTGEERDALGRLYTYFTEPELTAMLEAASFTVQHRASGVDKGLSGSMDPWFSLGSTH